MLNNRNTQPHRSHQDGARTIREDSDAAMVRQLIDVMKGRTKMAAEDFISLTRAVNRLKT